MKDAGDKRILIIGAGAAGLTAAEALREKGYSHVQILEKEPYPGGKCRSVKIDGRVYELGAGIISANNATVMSLVKKYGISLKKFVFEDQNLYDPATGGICEDTCTLPEKVSYFFQLLLRYRRLCRRYPGVQQPGHSGVEPELYRCFHDWAQEHRIPLVEDNFERFFTGFGYGHWENIPAAYTLKYCDWPSLVSYLRNEIYTFPDGIQGLWERVALEHDVHYDKKVQQVVRRKGSITVETTGGQYQADVLLLACPPDQLLAFLDAGQEERALLSKVRFTDYRTYVCRVADFPDRTGFFPAHFHPAKKGFPVFWYKRYAGNDLYTFYVLSDFSVPDEEILHHLEFSIRSLGGRLLSVDDVLKWNYFPHVGTREMQEGFYAQLEALQGQKDTYYLGELMNFSTVELSAAYSRHLVSQHF